ncbi:hypothetical protein NQ315_001093 [Exocentrus adspersus]|uniref:WH1 domain-containing protein n=1 Tax=Exocentrus adspersus TaxID=1586481 RepID=A0AAV8WFK3_9CUCU|nr:hypothetical protein NQ315_001093 [Exocentrus adspersus]
MIVLSCTIKKDFEYNKVMPTFHHWKTGDKKFGLTFQAAADARAFDKGVRTAVEDLLDGFADTSPSSPLPKCPKDVGDDDVFMTLDLPQDPKDSRSSSDSSTKGGENYPYVQLTAVHEYIYPAEEQQKPSMLRRDSASSLKKCSLGMEMLPAQQPPLPLKTKHKSKAQMRCRHCNELYTEDRNPRGGVRCVCYHCASDAEGEFAQHPCDCTDDENCTKRWCCLTFLSVFVPCLWLYPPLKICHWCGVKCGVCGGRHSM